MDLGSSPGVPLWSLPAKREEPGVTLQCHRVWSRNKQIKNVGFSKFLKPLWMPLSYSIIGDRNELFPLHFSQSIPIKSLLDREDNWRARRKVDKIKGSIMGVRKGAENGFQKNTKLKLRQSSKEAGARWI